MTEPRRYIAKDSNFEEVVHRLLVLGHNNITSSVRYSEVIIESAFYVDLAKGYFDEYAIEFFYGQNSITFEERELANRARKRAMLPKLPSSWDL